MWFLDFRTRDVGGPVATTPGVYEDSRLRGHGAAALPAPAGGVTFLVHGFNNSREDGRSQLDGFRRAAVEQVPGLGQTLFVGVLWPGDAVVGFLSYPTEEADADRTSRAFADTLARARLSPVPHFVAHSLGSRVVLRTLTLLAREDPDGAWADQVVLLAGAVDSDVLGRGDRYAAAAVSARRVVAVASTADTVLRFAFPAGDWIAGLFSGGYTRQALGRRGPAASPPAPRHVRTLQVGSLGVGHGDYLGGDSELRRRASRFTGTALEGGELPRY